MFGSVCRFRGKQDTAVTRNQVRPATKTFDREARAAQTRAGAGGGCLFVTFTCSFLLGVVCVAQQKKKKRSLPSLLLA